MKNPSKVAECHSKVAECHSKVAERGIQVFCLQRLISLNKE
jgi:hypothetical protein